MIQLMFFPGKEKTCFGTDDGKGRGNGPSQTYGQAAK